MRLSCLILLVSVSGVAMVQPFTDADRFGKTYAEVDAMGHRAWQAWFTDPSRAGESGKVQAEKIYALAVYEGNQRLLSGVDLSRRQYLDEVQNNFANLAKYSFVFRAGWDRSEEYALQIAESGSAINLTIRDLIKGKKTKISADSASVRRSLAEAAQRFRSRRPQGAQTQSTNLLGVESCLDRLDKLMANRPKREKRLVYRFVQTSIVPLAFGTSA